MKRKTFAGVAQANSGIGIPLADGSVHVVVTSPPYYGLRSYSGTGTWVGGNPDCTHEAARIKNRFDYDISYKQKSNTGSNVVRYKDECPACHAMYVDDQIGHERVHDCMGWARGENCQTCYVCRIRNVFAEIWRVLRDDGIVFLNLGDSYSSVNENGLKQKDLCGVPWRVALALQADGFYLRSDVIWEKLNPLPESVKDRPTKSHEYVFVLTKSPIYYWDHEPVREKYADSSFGRALHAKSTGSKWANTVVNSSGGFLSKPRQKNEGVVFGDDNSIGYMDADGTVLFNPGGRLIRTVWSIATKSFSGNHFAVFPPDLVERCIKAGSSERGACPTCGRPWVRIVDSRTPPDSLRNKGTGSKMDFHTHQTGSGQKLQDWYNANPPTSVGWRPDCNCYGVEIAEPFPRKSSKESMDEYNVRREAWYSEWRRLESIYSGLARVPCVALDPFNGSGTTGMVARNLGRSYVGLDLSMEYLQMAKSRIEGTYKPSRRKTPNESGNPSLFDLFENKAQEGE